MFIPFTTSAEHTPSEGVEGVLSAKKILTTSYRNLVPANSFAADNAASDAYRVVDNANLPNGLYPSLWQLSSSILAHVKIRRSSIPSGDPFANPPPDPKPAGDQGFAAGLDLPAIPRPGSTSSSSREGPLVAAHHDGVSGDVVIGSTIAAIFALILIAMAIDFLFESSHILRFKGRTFGSRYRTRFRSKFRSKHKSTLPETEERPTFEHLRFSRAILREFNLKPLPSGEKALPYLPLVHHPAWQDAIKPSRRRLSTYSISHYSRRASFDSSTGTLVDDSGLKRPMAYTSVPVPEIPSAQGHNWPSKGFASSTYDLTDVYEVVTQDWADLDEGEETIAVLSHAASSHRGYSGKIRPGMGVQKLKTHPRYNSYAPPATLNPFTDDAEYDDSDVEHDILVYGRRPQFSYLGVQHPKRGLAKKKRRVTEDLLLFEVDMVELEKAAQQHEKENFQMWRNFWKTQSMKRDTMALDAKGMQAKGGPRDSVMGARRKSRRLGVRSTVFLDQKMKLARSRVSDAVAVVPRRMSKWI